MSLISVSKVKIGYNNIPVVDKLSFDINEKDFICIVGPNGSGKTTLIRGILGLIPVMSGKITFSLNENQIGYMPQETTVDANFPASVFEIVLSGSLNKPGIFYSTETKNRASETLKMLGISKLEKQSFSELSGGQRQKVLLARALMATDKLLFLDEPSNNLDQKSKESLYELVQKLNAEHGITIVMVTHDLDHGNLIGNKILSLAPKDYFFGTTEEYVRKVHHE